MLKGKHIVLGITGSIAAYKTCSLIRLFVSHGAEVQVVITPYGKELITPLTLSTLSRRPVISEFFDRRDGSWHSHVEIGLWADLMIIAPCTASTLAKMAHGLADNMLITTYLSMRAPVFVAPAMDLDMFSHVATQTNLSILRQRGVHVIEPTSGELASQLFGKGRMEEPEVIYKKIEAFFQESGDLSGKRILITAGPTHERIDPVRFIANDSSGKMGFSIASECAHRGAIVTLIAGPVNLSINHPNITRVDVVSAQDMYEATTKVFPECDCAILSAAVADFTPSQISSEKLKSLPQTEGNDEFGSLKLVRTKDIACALGKAKKDSQILVGFALETHHEFENAQAKLAKKNLDFIVLNSLRDEGAGFKHDTNKVTIIDRSGNAKEYELKDKSLVAHDIIDHLVKTMNEKQKDLKQ